MQPNPYQQYPPQGVPQQPQQVPGTGGLTAPPPLMDASGGGDVKPNASHLYGRAVALVRTGYNARAKKVGAGADTPEDKKYAEEVTFDAYVFDGGDLMYGNKDKGTPEEKAFKKAISTPCVIRGMRSQNVLIVSELRDNGGAAALGRVQISEQGQHVNKPLKLVPLAPDDPARPLVSQLWGPMFGAAFPDGSTFQNPEPRDIAGQPQPQQQPAAVPQQAWPAQPQPPQMPVNGQVQYGQPAPQPQVQQQPAAPVNGSPWPQQQPAAPTNGGGGIAPPPPGWTPDAWIALTPEQRAAFTG